MGETTTMARIRTVKPEFWRDEKIVTLKNKSAGYFFIGLWNFSDDEGKFQNSPKQLSLYMPMFRPRDISRYLVELESKGLLMFSECSTWGLVTNWKHQRIDRPVLPQIKASEIKWVSKFNSTNIIEYSSSARRKDSIGKDSIVVEGTTSAFPENPKPNSSQNFNARFENPEALKLIEFFNSQEILTDVKIFVPQIIFRWLSFDNFMLFYNGIFSSPGFKKIDESDKASRKKYFMAALSSELDMARKAAQ